MRDGPIGGVAELAVAQLTAVFDTAVVNIALPPRPRRNGSDPMTQDMRRQVIEGTR
jgi:hypothetical protein